MKKYKLDSEDTMSVKSNSSGGSIEGLEKKIAALIINEKKKEISMTPSRISEVPEEYLSDNDDTLHHDTPQMTTNNSTFEDEDKESMRSMGNNMQKKKSSGPQRDVNKSKNALKNFVTQELDIKQSTKNSGFAQPQPVVPQSPLFPQGISQIQGQMLNPFGNYAPNSNLGFNKPQPNFNKPQNTQTQSNSAKVESSPGLFQRAGIANNGTVNNLFGVSGEMLNLNLLMMNQNNLNLYNPQEPVMNDNVGQPLVSLHSQGSINLSEDQKEEEKVFKLVEKNPESFQPSDFQGLHYACVDLNNGFIYFMSPMTKDNFPPTFVNTPGSTAGSINNLNTSMKSNQGNGKIPSMNDFVMASPALGSVNFSPNLFNNNNLLNLMKNQFSPGMNLFNESPGMDPRGFFNPEQPKLGNWSNEWTPEIPTRQIGADPNRLRQNNILWGNQFTKGSSPEQRYGGGFGSFAPKPG
jgi:hypothetical protein